MNLDARIGRLTRKSAIASALILAACLTSWEALSFVPLPQTLEKAPARGIRFSDRNGKILRESLVDGGRFVVPVSLEMLPRALIVATVSAEDKRFWLHRGIDPLALTRAIGDAIRARRVVSGASTISQQLVKMAAGHRRRTFWAKGVEALQTLGLEQSWTKQRILEAYLNRVDYGNLRIGVAAAASDYFGKPPGDLSVAECAFLAGLPQAPSRLNPRHHLERALHRQRQVLERMKRDRAISSAECERARAEAIRLAPRPAIFDAPHFVDLVAQQPRLTKSREVRTTLDLGLTKFCSQTLRHHLALLRDQHVQNGAVVVIENRTGNVLALVGSENYFAPASGQVNGAWAARSAGSALKPFTYLLAFENGATPVSIVADVPVDFATPTGIYRPENYNHICYGPVRLRVALANSLNIPAVKMLASIGGAAPLCALLGNCGLSTLNRSPAQYGLGLTIGNANVRLLELVNAYAALARLGEYQPYRLLQSEPPPPRRRIGESDACYLIADILSDNAARALTFGTDSRLRFDFPVAVKTGTSTSFRDNWAIGFTPEFTAGVWVGNFDGSAMRDVSGVSGAAPVLHQIINHLHREIGSSWYRQPPTVTERLVHPLTGKLALHPGPGLVREKLVFNKLPPPESPEDYDADGRVKLGAEYRSWFLSSESQFLHQLSLADSDSGALQVVAPLPGATYYLDPDLPESDRLPLKSNGRGRLVWESATLQCAVAADGPFARLKEGRHSITLRNPATGAQAETWIVVKTL